MGLCVIKRAFWWVDVMLHRVLLYLRIPASHPLPLSLLLLLSHSLLTAHCSTLIFSSPSLPAITHCLSTPSTKTSSTNTHHILSVFFYRPLTHSPPTARLSQAPYHSSQTPRRLSPVTLPFTHHPPPVFMFLTLPYIRQSTHFLSLLHSSPSHRLVCFFVTSSKNSVSAA